MSNQAPTNHTQRSSWPLILILVIVVVPIVAAYVAYYTGMGVADDTVNEGTLLQPPVDTRELTDEPLGEDDEHAEQMWRLLIPLSVPCDEECKKNLYTTRQVHIRLGEKGMRLERVAVNLAGAEGSAYLQRVSEEHPLLEQVSVDPADWQAWLSQTNVPTDKAFYLLVDPQGYAMMVYTTEHHGNELLDDLKRILRFTPE